MKVVRLKIHAQKCAAKIFTCHAYFRSCTRKKTQICCTYLSVERRSLPGYYLILLQPDSPGNLWSAQFCWAVDDHLPHSLWKKWWGSALLPEKWWSSSPTSPTFCAAPGNVSIMVLSKNWWLVLKKSQTQNTRNMWHKVDRISVTCNSSINLEHETIGA